MSSLIAGVCKIEEIQPHLNADRLEMARIRNWWCVVKKGEFIVGEKVVYIPPETVVPNEVAEAWGVARYCSVLPKLGDKTRPKGLRVRACRLRGVPSQGLILIPEDNSWELGHSVVEHYQLKKYEPPEPPNAGEALAAPANFVRYTNIEHIGNFPNTFQKGEEVVVDEKIHGTNARAGYIRNALQDNEMAFVAGSHRQLLKEISDKGMRSTYWITMTNEMRSLLQHLSGDTEKDVIVFCEIFGRKIQDMEYGMSDVGYRAYDIAIDGQYMDYDPKMALFEKFNIPVVPNLYRGPFSFSKMEELVDGDTQLCDPQKAGRFSGREGIVIRPVLEGIDSLIGRRILKMISVDYHERGGETTEYH